MARGSAQLLNGTQADMDRARVITMSDSRYAELDELLHLADSSRENRLRLLRAIRDVGNREGGRR